MAVKLIQGKGFKGRGGGAGGYYWHIYQGGVRAGHVYINSIEDEDLGKHSSLSLEINKTMQGKGIGTEAYRLASEQSNLAKLYIHIRKSNIASRKAAEKASFKAIETPHNRQLIMLKEVNI
jgi:RimJ/RimL family protein N-acetyltransferase